MLGLDPADVFESLPDSMKKCFESQDIGMLQQVIKEMPEEDARFAIWFQQSSNFQHLLLMGNR